MTSSAAAPALHPLGPTARQGNTAFAMSVAILIVRLMLGWTFIYHGSQKLFGAFGGPGIDAFAQVLAGMHLPAFLPVKGWAYLAAGGEMVGGVSVLLGLLARLGTIPIIVTMLVAIANVHGKNGFGGFFDPAKGMQTGYEFNVNLIAMCVAVLVAGPGLISLDAVLFRRGLWARGPQPLNNPVTPG